MKYALIGCGRIAVNHVKAVLNNQLFREQSASGQRKKQTTLFMYLPIPLDCTPIFTN